MEIISQFISEDLIYALGWTVLHTLWQGFLIAIILAFVLNFWQKKSAKLRYEASLTALFLVLISSICTFIWYFDEIGQVATGAKVDVSNGTVVNLLASPEPGSVLYSFLESCKIYFNEHLPIIVLIWLVGVAFFVLRLIGGLAYVQRLKNYKTNKLPSFWQNKVQDIANKIPLRKAVPIFESAMIQVPMMVGHLKPVILLPIGAINQLEEHEVESIISHELAHVYRNDFLMNILISVVEVLFYYHPAVWWISGNIRLERENCCDDMAIQLCGNSLNYAKTLVRLQELQTYAPGFAMPFSGQRKQLLSRIHRILNQPQTRSNILEKLAATAFLLIAVLFMSMSSGSSSLNSELLELENEQHITVEVEHVQVDSLPEKTDRTLKAKQLEVLQKDGEVIQVIVDGEIMDIDELEEYNEFESESKITVRVLEDEAYPTGLGSSDVRFYSFNTEKDTSEPINRFKVWPNQKEQEVVVKSKKIDGNTVIIVESGSDDPIEIQVVEEDGQIMIDGERIDLGDSITIVNELSAFPKTSSFFRFDSAVPVWDTDSLVDLQKRYFDTTTGFHGFINDDTYLYYTNDSIVKWFQGDSIRIATGIVKADKKLKKLEKKNKLKWHKLEKQRAKRLKEIEKTYKDAEVKLLEKEIARTKVFEDNRFIIGKINNNDHSTIIANELKKDGLIKSTDNFSFSLSGKKLKVNGKKQAANIHKKYLELYESLTGSKMNKKSSYQINFKKN